MAAAEHFQAKWIPIRVKKMRYNNDLEVLSDSAESESALATGFRTAGLAELTCFAGYLYKERNCSYRRPLFLAQTGRGEHGCGTIRWWK
jgi:hypothetical protein